MTDNKYEYAIKGNKKFAEHYMPKESSKNTIINHVTLRVFSLFEKVLQPISNYDQYLTLTLIHNRPLYQTNFQMVHR